MCQCIVKVLLKVLRWALFKIESEVRLKPYLSSELEDSYRSSFESHFSTKITNMVSTTTVFGLCTCKWGN